MTDRDGRRTTMKLLQKLSFLYTEERSSFPLGLFRIVYGICLFLEIWQLLDKYELFFSPIPFIVSGEVFLRPALYLWALACLAVAAGFRTRHALVANFVMTVVFFSTTSQFEYHIDYIYTIINLLLLFVPVEASLSIDGYLDPGTRRQSVPRAYFDALLLCGIAVVYFDSSLYKLAADSWTSGLGLWRPAALPAFTLFNPGWALEFEGLMRGLGYLTIIFEISFIVLMWFDKLRWLLALVGFGLHFGITLCFPIPLFGLALIGLYLLVLPDRVWSRNRSSSPELDITSAQALGHKHAEKVRLKWLTAATLVFCLLQVIYLSRSPLASWISDGSGFDERSQASLHRSQESTWAQRFRFVSRTYFGATARSLFVDQHFDGLSSVMTLVEVDKNGEHTWLPIVDQSSRFSRSWTGRLWVWWLFRVNGPHATDEQVDRAVMRVSAWWIGEHPSNSTRREFLVIEKPYEATSIANGWEAERYARLEAAPWRPVAKATWTGRQFHIERLLDGRVADADF